MKRGRSILAEAEAQHRAEAARANSEFDANTHVMTREGLRSLAALPPIEDIPTFQHALPAIGEGGIHVAPSRIEGAGNGLFATRDFAAGEIVTFYDGPIARYEPPALLSHAIHSHARVLVPYRFMIIGNAPSAELGHWGRGGGALINDSRDNATTNVEFFHIDSVANTERFEQYSDPTTLDPFGRTVIVRARRAIQAGEEFYVSYGIGYWTLDAPAARQEVEAAKLLELLYIQPSMAPTLALGISRFKPTPMHSA